VPFTPLHKGPAIFIQALPRCSFSLMVFGRTQIVMGVQPPAPGGDAERGTLHGASHSYAGATLLAVFST